MMRDSPLTGEALIECKNVRQGYAGTADHRRHPPGYISLRTHVFLGGVGMMGWDRRRMGRPLPCLQTNLRFVAFAREAP